MILLLSLFVAFTAVGGELKLEPGDKNDYGSGSVELSQYWAGGIGDRMGCAAGHPNHLSRKDRILLRFDLSSLYLQRQLPSIHSATLCLRLYWDSNPELRRQLTIRVLDYDPQALSVFDLSAPQTAVIGTFPIRLKQHPLMTVEVTAAVRRALENRQLYLGFRISDSAEDRENHSGKHICSIIETPALNSGHNPVLYINYDAKEEK